ncbi:MAG: hypothetical protein P1U30_10425, partial [Phycisphaerales bacterium]|nr:hypothetical protein [Phycisphaerales bacterium]
MTIYHQSKYIIGILLVWWASTLNGTLRDASGIPEIVATPNTPALPVFLEQLQQPIVAESPRRPITGTEPNQRPGLINRSRSITNPISIVGSLDTTSNLGHRSRESNHDPIRGPP